MRTAAIFVVVLVAAYVGTATHLIFCSLCSSEGEAIADRIRDELAGITSIADLDDFMQNVRQLLAEDEVCMTPSIRTVAVRNPNWQYEPACFVTHFCTPLTADQADAVSH
jgi:hypothetical protein